MTGLLLVRAVVRSQLSARAQAVVTGQHPEPGQETRAQSAPRPEARSSQIHGKIFYQRILKIRKKSNIDVVKYALLIPNILFLILVFGKKMLILLAHDTLLTLYVFH